MRGQHLLTTPSEWDETGTSAAATLQNVVHDTPASPGQSYLAGLAVYVSDGSYVAWNLDAPDATLHLSGYGPAELVFDPPLVSPLGGDWRLEIAAGAGGVTTRGNIWGYDQQNNE